MTNNLVSKSINQLHQLLKQKKISSVELTKEALKRTTKFNSKTNAFITVNQKHALNQAIQADKKIKNSTGFSKLCGIPFSVKDVYLTKKVKTTSGSNVLKNYFPVYNATVYQKLIDQGAVLIGKNNQDAWGHGGSSENTDFEPVKNPWDLKRVAGGSSGGTAAAIASDTVNFGIAEDTGGSIRNPSSFCSTTGLKVTYGRVSRYGTIAYASSLDTVGPMAHSVEDCAYVLEAIAGHDPKDASSSRQPVPQYTKNINQTIKNKTLGILDEYFTKDLQPSVKKTLDQAIQTFKNLGLKIKSVSIPTAKYGVSIYYLLALSETSSNLARYDGVRYGQTRDKFTKETKRRIMLGSFAISSGYYDAYYKKALQARTKLIQEFTKAYEKVDAIIAPVMPFPAYRFGAMDTKENYIVSMYLADLYTCATNPAGVPSLALPAGFDNQGLPVGMQLIGPMFSEDKLLNIGHAYQQNTNWHLQKPKL